MNIDELIKQVEFKQQAQLAMIADIERRINKLDIEIKELKDGQRELVFC